LKQHKRRYEVNRKLQFHSPRKWCGHTVNVLVTFLKIATKKHHRAE
jgi:hypothetical protein